MFCFTALATFQNFVELFITNDTHILVNVYANIIFRKQVCKDRQTKGHTDRHTSRRDNWN